MLVEQSIKLAADWLSNSDILAEEGCPECRAVKGGYDVSQGRYDCIYHEINGYAISCFVDLFKVTRDKEYLLRARSVAEYLLSTLSGNGGVESVAFMHSVGTSGGEPVRRYFAFDNGMIASGLLDIYGVTGDRRYFNAAHSCVHWIIDNLQMEDGSMHSYLDGDSGEIWHHGTRFDKDRSVLHAKLAIPLLKLWSYERDGNLLDAVHSLLQWGMKLQDDDGAFWSNEHRKVVFTHSHCYAAEGYLYAYHVTSRSQYHDVAAKAIGWLNNVQLSDGSLNYQYRNRQSLLDGIKDRLTRRKTSDATAQAVRLWLLMDAACGSQENRDSAIRAVEFLRSMQCLDEGRNSFGGIFYRRKESLMRSHLQEVLYSWCTHFAVQALDMWRTYDKGELHQQHVERLF